MDGAFLNLTTENLDREHLCCIIRSKKTHPGVEAKRQWLSDRLKEGHVFRKLDAKATVFIEYAPLETAWVPVLGDNYLYIYCLWVLGGEKGKGVCMLGAAKQKAWLSDQSFAQKFGFEAADATDYGYTLLARSFDGTVPRFAPQVKEPRVEGEELTIFYDFQCPYILQSVELARSYCQETGTPVTFHPVDSLEKAKALPCVFNNWAVFYKGKFETVNLLDLAALKRILKK